MKKIFTMSIVAVLFVSIAVVSNAQNLKLKQNIEVKSEINNRITALDQLSSGELVYLTNYWYQDSTNWYEHYDVKLNIGANQYAVKKGVNKGSVFPYIKVLNDSIWVTVCTDSITTMWFDKTGNMLNSDVIPNWAWWGSINGEDKPIIANNRVLFSFCTFDSLGTPRCPQCDKPQIGHTKKLAIWRSQLAAPIEVNNVVDTTVNWGTNFYVNDYDMSHIEYNAISTQVTQNPENPLTNIYLFFNKNLGLSKTIGTITNQGTTRLIVEKSNNFVSPVTVLCWLETDSTTRYLNVKRIEVTGETLWEKKILLENELDMDNISYKIVGDNLMLAIGDNLMVRNLANGNLVYNKETADLVLDREISEGNEFSYNSKLIDLKGKTFLSNWNWETVKSNKKSGDTVIGQGWYSFRQLTSWGSQIGTTTIPDTIKKPIDILNLDTYTKDSALIVFGLYRGYDQIEQGFIHVYVLEDEIMKVPNPIGTVCNIYPNPTQDILHIDNISAKRVEIYDVTGKQILTREVSENVSKFTLNISEYPTGVYYLNITGAGNTQTKKIIKL